MSGLFGPSTFEARFEGGADGRPLLVDDAEVGAVALAHVGVIWCLRMMPSNWAGRRVIAPRERSLRASVFSSTRTQPSVSKARVSISSFVSTLTPVFHTEGLNQVQPISTTRLNGRG
jgi:hypothetical protein